MNQALSVQLVDTRLEVLLVTVKVKVIASLNIIMPPTLSQTIFCLLFRKFNHPVPGPVLRTRQLR